jgi:hypothetical protein
VSVHRDEHPRLARTNPKGEVGQWRCESCGQEGAFAEFRDTPCRSDRETQEAALIASLEPRP